jgi:dihydropteroate synthase
MQLPTSAPLVMGILNVTPDSFSDGGKYSSMESALRQAEKMVGEGADIIDIGGESTRPGAEPVSQGQEWQRVIPVIEALKKNFSVRLSIDTQKFEIAEAAVQAGATLINDISGGRDIRLVGLLKTNPKTEIVLMHMQGEPRTMQENPQYAQGAVWEIKKFLEKRTRAFTEDGLSRDRIWVDPGFGFGKSLNHNLDLLRHLNQFSKIGGRVLIGVSRKSFLGKVLNEDPIEAGEAGSLASSLWAYAKGASVFRVHEVAPMKRALKTWEAIANGCL